MTFGDRLRFALVTGCGFGLAPVAPGTFGTLPGVGLALGLQLFLEGMPLAVALWATAALLLAAGCTMSGFVARHFARDDPGAFVLDEIVGYLVTVALFASVHGWPGPEVHAAAFLAFRLFDVVKLPPARRLEDLHGAAGIMADDVAAGVHAGLVLVLLPALGVL